MRTIKCGQTLYIIHSPWEWSTAKEWEEELREQYPSMRIIRLNTGVKEDEEYAENLETELDAGKCEEW